MSHLKGVLLVVFQSVVQQHTQGHDTAVKFAILGGPVGVYDDGGLIGEDVAPLSPLALNLFLPLPFLLLSEKNASVRRALQTKFQINLILKRQNCEMLFLPPNNNCVTVLFNIRRNPH